MGPRRELDTAAFEQAATGALSGRDLEVCRIALDLYGGEFLPEDQGEPWAEGPRLRLARLYYRLVLHLVDLCGARGEMAEAEEQLRILLVTDPIRHEDAALRLMVLLAGQGKRAEALRVYQALATAMDAELGVAPGR